MTDPDSTASYGPTPRGLFVGRRPLPWVALGAVVIGAIGIVVRLLRLGGWSVTVVLILGAAAGIAVGVAVAQRRVPARLARVASMTGAVAVVPATVDVVVADHQRVLRDLNRSPRNGGPSAAEPEVAVVYVAFTPTAITMWLPAVWRRTTVVPPGSWSIPVAEIVGAQLVSTRGSAVLLLDRTGGRLTRISIKDQATVRQALLALGVPAATESANCPFHEGDRVVTPDGDNGTVATVLPAGEIGTFSVIITHPGRASTTWVPEQLHFA